MEEVKVKRHEDTDEPERNKVVQLERDKRPVHQRSTVTSLLWLEENQEDWWRQGNKNKSQSRKATMTNFDEQTAPPQGGLLVSIQYDYFTNFQSG